MPVRAPDVNLLARCHIDASRQDAARWLAAMDSPQPDAEAVRALVKPMRELAKLSRGGGAEANELILAAIRAGAFSGLGWISFRARLAPIASFTGVVFLITSTPTSCGLDDAHVDWPDVGDIRYGAPLVADILDREADRLGGMPAGQSTGFPPLSDREQAVYDAIPAEGGVTGKEIWKRTGVPQSTLTKHIIPRLKIEFGIANRRGVGYYRTRAD